MDLTRLPQTDPLNAYRYRDGLYAADLVTTAITEFDFFSWLSERPSSAEAIAEAFGFAARPLDVMLTLFAANRFVRRVGSVFEVTDLAREHLTSTSPFFLGPYYASLRDRPVARDFMKILRTGKPANWGSFQHEKEWSEAMLTDDFAKRFTAAMDCRGAFLGAALARSVDLAKRRRLLDIGGGSGIYSCAFAARHPAITATVLERSPVDEIARRMIRQRGYATRVDVIAGDMFAAPLPGGFDVHLFSNVIHDWDTDKVFTLLAASFAALAPGGMLLIHDAHVNATKDGPLPVAEYSALLMAVTEGKCYSLAELESLLTSAGFTGMRYTPTVADRSVVTCLKPA